MAQAVPKATAAPQPSGIEIVDLTPENIARLTDLHVTRYENMLDAAKDPHSRRSYNVPQLFQLLRVWSSVREKKHLWTELICCERTEILQAIESGE